MNAALRMIFFFFWPNNRCDYMWSFCPMRIVIGCDQWSICLDGVGPHWMFQFIFLSSSLFRFCVSQKKVRFLSIVVYWFPESVFSCNCSYAWIVQDFWVVVAITEQLSVFHVNTFSYIPTFWLWIETKLILYLLCFSSHVPLMLLQTTFKLLPSIQLTAGLSLFFFFVLQWNNEMRIDISQSSHQLHNAPLLAVCVCLNPASKLFVWSLRDCFSIIPEPKMLKIWSVPVFFFLLFCFHQWKAISPKPHLSGKTNKGDIFSAFDNGVTGVGDWC